MMKFKANAKLFDDTITMLLLTVVITILLIMRINMTLVIDAPSIT